MASLDIFTELFTETFGTNETPVVIPSEPTPPNIAIKVAVWAKATAVQWRKVSEIQTWESLDLEPRYLQPGPWSLLLPYDAQTAKIAKEHLITFDFRGTRMTGVIEKLGPRGDAEGGGPMLEISGSDAMTLLGDALCWPIPDAAVTAQAKAYYKASGVAETLLRDLILANTARLGIQWTVAASQGRGLPITLNERFSILLAVVQAKCEVASLGLRVGLVDTTSSTRAEMRAEFFTPVDRSNRVRLSHAVGTLRSWSQEDTAPTGTRTITAGTGAKEARIFRQIISDAAETEWGRRREVFIDARDAETTTEMDERANEALLEAAAQSAFELESAEAEGMRYGDHYGLGDWVTVELLTGVSKVDQLRAVQLKADISSGLTVQLVPGNPDAVNPMFGQASIIREIRRHVAALEKGT